MQYMTDLLLSAAGQVHWIAFFGLLLAGLNLPVSEDLTIIISASIAATVVPENTVKIFIGCFMGAYISDIMAYMIGRYGLNRLRHIAFFKKFIHEERIATIQSYFSRYGLLTLFIGRFFPFGVRNILFMTSGLIKMPLPKFMLVDVSALTVTTSILFYLGYVFGKNYEMLIPYVNQYKFILLGVLIVIILIAFVRKKGMPGSNRNAAAPDMEQ